MSMNSTPAVDLHALHAQRAKIAAANANHRAQIALEFLKINGEPVSPAAIESAFNLADEFLKHQVAPLQPQAAAHKNT